MSILPGSGGLAVDLLERASFLETLAEYAGEARQGNGRLVLVSGESGIGKTALLEAFQERCRGPAGCGVAVMACSPPGRLARCSTSAPQLDGRLAGLCRGGAPRDRLFAAFLAELGPARPRSPWR